MNHKMIDAYKSTNSIVFSFLEYVPDSNTVKEREDLHIKANWEDPLLLNVCDNAYAFKKGTNVAQIAANYRKSKHRLY